MKISTCCSLLLASSLSLFIGCGYDSSDEGVNGLLVYSYNTDYDTADHLTTAKLATGLTHGLSVQMTELGESQITEPWKIVHSLPQDAGSISTDPVSEGNREVGNATLSVFSPGVYDVLSRIGDTVIDQIALTFDDIDRIDVSSYVRAPYASEWDIYTPTDTIVVEEGTQLAFLSIPFNATDERLLGHLDMKIEASPANLVVPGGGAVWIYEDGVSQISGDADLYFIEPGVVTITLTEATLGVSFSQTFEVTEMSL